MKYLIKASEIIVSDALYYGQKEDSHMKLHYQGKYDLNPESLPHGEHQPNAVPFKEAKDSKTMALIANTASIVIMVLLAVPAVLRGKAHFDPLQMMLGCIALRMMYIFIRTGNMGCCLWLARKRCQKADLFCCHCFPISCLALSRI